MVEYFRQLNKYYHATLCTGIKTKNVLASNINMLNDIIYRTIDFCITRVFL